MKIFYGSDLHADFGHRELPDGYDLYLLAGDIAELANDVHYQIFGGKNVLWTPGNHEYYRSTIEEAEGEAPEGLLQNSWRDFPEEKLRVFGATFWTDFKDSIKASEIALKFMNDYKWISKFGMPHNRKLEPIDTYLMNERSRKRLKVAQETLPEGWRFIVMTHHAPFLESLDPNFSGPKYSDKYYINLAYANDLDNWCIKNKVFPDYWIHGHIHRPAHYDKKIGQKTIKVRSNPYGYPGENQIEEWNSKCLEL